MMTEAFPLKRKREPIRTSLLSKDVVMAVALLQVISLLAFGFNITYQFATFITITQCVLFFLNVGKNIPIRYMIGTLFSVYYLFVPIIMFKGLNDYVFEDYRMVGAPSAYFEYAIPGMLALIAGLHLFNTKELVIDKEKVGAYLKITPRLPYFLIIIGLVSGIVEPYVPSELSIVFECASNFKFVGFFLSLFNGKDISYKYLAITYGYAIVMSLAFSLFGEFLDMLLFLTFYLAMRYKPSNLFKVVGLLCVFAVIVFIQIIKFPLREQATGNLSDLNNFGNVLSETQATHGEKTFNDKAAEVLSRLDEGWVLSHTMEYQKSGGFELQQGNHALIILESSVLPRILAPDKLQVGDPQEFNKYSGHNVQSGTSIGLGIFSDGYIDFGFWGIFEVFCFGMIINLFINMYVNMSKKYPLIILFLCVGFTYPVRPDNDSQAALGALFKMTFLLWLAMMYLKNNNKNYARIASLKRIS